MKASGRYNNIDEPKIAPENVVKDGQKYRFVRHLAEVGGALNPFVVAHRSKDGRREKQDICKGPLPYEADDPDFSIAREVLGGMFNRYVVGEGAPKVVARREATGHAKVLSRMMVDSGGQRCLDLVDVYETRVRRRESVLLSGFARAVIIRYLAGDHLQDIKCDNMLLGSDGETHNIDTNFWRHCAHAWSNGERHTVNAVTLQEAEKYPHVYASPFRGQEARTISFPYLFSQDGVIDFFTREGLIKVIAAGIEDHGQRHVNTKVVEFRNSYRRLPDRVELQDIMKQQREENQRQFKGIQRFFGRCLPSDHVIQEEAIVTLRKIGTMPDEHIDLLAGKAAEVIPDDEHRRYHPTRGAVQEQFRLCLRGVREKAQEVLQHKSISFNDLFQERVSRGLAMLDEVSQVEIDAGKKTWISRTGNAVSAPDLRVIREKAELEKVRSHDSTWEERALWAMDVRVCAAVR